MHWMDGRAGWEHTKEVSLQQTSALRMVALVLPLGTEQACCKGCKAVNHLPPSHAHCIYSGALRPLKINREKRRKRLLLGEELVPTSGDGKVVFSRPLLATITRP